MTNFLRLNLIDKHGVSDHRGVVLVVPSQIESIRSFIHTDHLRSHHEVGSTVAMKTGDKHHVSQHTDEIVDMLQGLIARGGESGVTVGNPRTLRRLESPSGRT